MQQQFTDKAQKALQLAAKTARDLHQSYIGSEHLLVGLVKEKTGVAAKVLAENGVEESRLFEMIRELIAPESSVSIQERDGYSPRAMKILEESHGSYLGYFRIIHVFHPYIRYLRIEGINRL